MCPGFPANALTLAIGGVFVFCTEHVSDAKCYPLFPPPLSSPFFPVVQSPATLTLHSCAYVCCKLRTSKRLERVGLGWMILWVRNYC